VTVDCDSFAEALAERGPARELARHAAMCERCRSLWEVDQVLRHSETPRSAPPMAAALQRQLFEHRPTKYATSFGTRALSVLAAVTASLGLTMLAVPRRDLSLATLTGWTPGILLFLLLSSLALFAYRGRTGLGVAPWLRWSVPIACIVVFELMAGLEARRDGLAAKLDCLFLGLMIAGVVAAVSCRVSRRTALVAPAASGALAGAVAGVTALICLRVHCPSLLAPHVMIVHVLPLLIAIAAGAYAGRRWLSV
jgi:hypothetical protein